MHAETAASVPASVPVMSGRRAFLLASATFVAGAAIGGGGGFAWGLGHPGVSAPAVAEPVSEELAELRWLAVEAPIEDLMEKRLAFLACVVDDYPGDLVLWRGVERLARDVLDGAQVPDRRRFATWLAQVIEKGDPNMAGHLVPFATQLRRIR